MKCTKCDGQMIKGVIYGRSGTHWMPQEEYEKSCDYSGQCPSCW